MRVECILFAHQFLELGFDGFGPDGVAGFAEVEEVGHDFAAEGAVFLEELGADVEVVHGLAVGEFLKNGVGAFVDLTAFVGGIGAAREDAEDEGFCLGSFVAEIFPAGIFFVGLTG